ncbi:MAG: ABC transporter permease subunit [Campylobacteraceae bacterium]|nr:ABC transporter permease subunit [Campylobacteraceae bacterium]
MIKTDGVDKKRAVIWKIVDYLWGGFSTLGVVFMLIALWQLGHERVGDFLLPAPYDVFIKSVKVLKEYENHDLLLSLERSILGVGFACVVGIFFGLIAGYFKSMRVFLKPIATILLSMPPIIWIVLALFWFGFGGVSVLFTIFLTVLPLTFSSSMIGMASVNVELIEMFDAYKLGIYKKIRYLYLPHLTSFIISSLSVAIAMGVKIVVMAELLSGTDGIGGKIGDARIMLEMDMVLAYVLITITFIGLCEYLIIKPLSIALMPWRRDAGA